MAPKDPVRSLITSREVAALAGVSQATVSRVARRSGNVSAKTRETVLRVLAETGYQPDPAARSMRSGQTGLLGVAIGSFAGADPHLLDALADAAARHGLAVAVWGSAGASRPPGAARRMVDGLILLDDAADAGEGVPMVAIGGEARPEHDHVSGDDVELGRRIAGYFAGAGRMHVGLIGPEADLRPGGSRAEGFRRGAALHDLRLPHGSIVPCGEGRDAAFTVFSRLIRDSARLPQAIVCTRAEVGLGVMEAAREVGIRIPQDIWVVGLGDSAIAETRGYGLTTACAPPAALAAAALSLLRERMGDPARAIEHRRIPCTILVRASTGGVAIP